MTRIVMLALLGVGLAGMSGCVVKEHDRVYDEHVTITRSATTTNGARIIVIRTTIGTTGAIITERRAKALT